MKWQLQILKAKREWIDPFTFNLQRAWETFQDRFLKSRLKDWREKEFKGTGTMRGIGWAILYQDNLTRKLFDCWINEHDVGHPAGCPPILILDIFEHAFMIDYGLKRTDYIEAFFKNINWKTAEGRFK